MDDCGLRIADNCDCELEAWTATNFRQLRIADHELLPSNWVANYVLQNGC